MTGDCADTDSAVKSPVGCCVAPLCTHSTQDSSPSSTQAASMLHVGKVARADGFSTFSGNQSMIAGPTNDAISKFWGIYCTTGIRVLHSTADHLLLSRHYPTHKWRTGERGVAITSISRSPTFHRRRFSDNKTVADGPTQSNTHTLRPEIIQ